MIYVTCTNCKEQFEEYEVKFLDIEEDIQGRDLLTFECPICGEDVKSYRVRR